MLFILLFTKCMIYSYNSLSVYQLYVILNFFYYRYACFMYAIFFSVLQLYVIHTFSTICDLFIQQSFWISIIRNSYFLASMKVELYKRGQLLLLFTDNIQFHVARKLFSGIFSYIAPLR